MTKLALRGWGLYTMKKPWVKKSEMHRDLPFKRGTVVSASERRGGALYKVEPCRKVNTKIKGCEKMACEREKENLDTCTSVSECDKARIKWLECMASTMMARMGHAQTMDERLMERLKLTIKEVLEESIDVPPRPYGMWSDKVRNEIFDSSEKAMIFSENIAKAFEETGIELKDNETFACLMCVIKKPKYISEVTGLGPQPEPPDQPRVNYIMEPVIMKQVMDTLEQDKIKY